jgi:hypothetical protein
MPFDVEFNEMYDHLKSLIGDDFQVLRGDDLLNQQAILKDIVLLIHESDLIIADLSGLNPNVFYELGLAHALRKNVILLTQDIGELPFDLRSYRTIEYSTHFAKIKELEEKLKHILKGVQDNTVSFGNPVSDWLPFGKEAEVNRSLSSEVTNTFKEDAISTEPHLPEDRGFLDYMADIDESMAELKGIVENFSKKQTEITANINPKCEEIAKAWLKPSSGTASYVRKIARKIAADMNEYGLNASDLNKKYNVTWDLFEDSILNLVINPIATKTSENIAGFRGFLDSLEELKGTMITTKSQYMSLADTVCSLKGIERDITRSALLIEGETKTFVGLLDKSISTLDRAVALGREKIENRKEEYL